MHIEKVYMPRIPELSSPSLRRDFGLALLAANSRVLGDTTGSMEADFLNFMSSLNRGSFSYQFVSQGDTIIVESSQFEVLWPPEKIEKGSVVKSIETAVSDFESALAKDEATKRIYDSMVEADTVGRYLSEEEGMIESKDEEPFERRNTEIPEVVKVASKSLRDAANRLSLAFREDNRFLFLGDLEKSELRQVSGELDNQGATNYFTLLTAHHGTHWHDSMKKLKCHNALSSIGSRLFKYYCPEYKAISKRSLLTYTNGALVHGLPPAGMNYRHWRHYHYYPWW